MGVTETRGLNALDSDAMYGLRIFREDGRKERLLVITRSRTLLLRTTYNEVGVIVAVMLL